LGLLVLFIASLCFGFHLSTKKELLMAEPFATTPHAVVDTTSATTTTAAAEAAADVYQPTGFSDINAEQLPTEMESLCMSCGENGTTRMLLTRIPHFKEIIIMAFECPHCNFRNNEVQFGGSFQDKGVRYTVTLTEPTVCCATTPSIT
jgi:hypothetical protein